MLVRSLVFSAFMLLCLSKQAARGQPNKSLPITGDPVPALAPFDDLMLSFIAEHEVPGAALAIAKDGELVYTRGFGYADPDTNEKALPTSLFRIASVSKPITAVAILMLIERGKLKLDDKAFKVLALPTPPGRKRDPRAMLINFPELADRVPHANKPAARVGAILRRSGNAPVLIAREKTRGMNDIHKPTLPS